MKGICPSYNTCMHKFNVGCAHCAPHEMDDKCAKLCFGKVVCITVPELRKRKLQELSKPK